MPPRTMTRRGFRSMTPVQALPRETQAVAKATQNVAGKSEQLVKASSPGQVQAVLEEAFAETMMDMALRRDPHVSYWAVLYWLLDDSGAVTPASADFFDPVAAGAAAAPVPGRWHNLLKENTPIKPSLIHNISIDVLIQSVTPGWLELSSIYAANLKLRRQKDDVFEFPLCAALASCGIFDSAATAPALLDIEPVTNGGLEIEGHGVPFLVTEAMGLEMEFNLGNPTFAAQAAGDTGMVMIVARMDGEVMD